MKIKSLPFFFLFLLAALVSSARAIVIVGSMTQRRDALPGASYQGSILVKNGAIEAHGVNIYQTDYHFDADGRNVYAEPGRSPRSNAAWISFSPRRLSIPAGGTAEIRYTVHIPGEPGLVGTYWSLLMVEDTGSAVSRDAEKRKGMATSIRYGVQIATSIGDTGTSKLRFSKAELRRGQGSLVLSLRVENAGERWLAPSFSAELFGADGKSAGRFKGIKTALYPGTSTLVSFELASLPKGKYKAMVIADNGDERVYGAQYQFIL
jgi:hypothetical protein